MAMVQWSAQLLASLLRLVVKQGTCHRLWGSQLNLREFLVPFIHAGGHRLFMATLCFPVAARMHRLAH